jgi:hypothetical protein
MSGRWVNIGLAGLLSGAMANFAAPASAAVTYSFSGLDLNDWTNNGLQVTLNGTITIPEFDSFGWTPPTAIDIDVYYAGQLIRSFTDPNYLLYYAVEVGDILDISSDINHPDAEGDYVGLTFYGDTNLVYGDFSALAFEHGFETKSAVPFTVSVPEPSTWAMMLLGFAGLGFAGYRASRRTAAAPA